MKSHLYFFVVFIAFTFSSCHLGRFVWFNYANITDHEIFPYTEVNTSGTPFFFEDATDTPMAMKVREITISNEDNRWNLDKYLDEETRTVGFVVIKNDSILFENYYEDYDRTQISNIFSVSKSITSLLVGIAVDEGYIKSVDDPITDYVPALKKGDSRFQRLTIQHLLDMRSGIDYNESYTNPFKHMAKLYYGKDQLGQIEKMTFLYEPGTVHRYQSVCTSLLGIAVEKSTGKELGVYLEEKVWKPMGMENSASWSVDDNKHRSTKAYCCLNTTAIDLAKIARLYLNMGNWNGQQIISKEWIIASTTPNLENEGYQNQWYGVHGVSREDGKVLTYPDSLSAEAAAKEKEYLTHIVYKKGAEDWRIYYGTNNYYALGILGQHMYIDPDQKLIIVRLGEKWDENYFRIFQKIQYVIQG